MRYATADIHKLGTILGIWAHPDDEAWAMAGVIAAARHNNQRVVIVTATRGEAGGTADPIKWPIEDLAEIRTREMEACLQVMGVSEHHWLNLVDGQLNRDTKAISMLTDLTNSVRPTTIFSFAPDGITGHPDHKTVSQWTKAAVQASDVNAQLYGAIESEEKYKVVCEDCPSICKNVYFNTRKPHTVPMAKVDLCFPLSSELQEIKRQALKCQPSQTTGLFDNQEGLDFIAQQVACECFVSL